MSGFVSLLGAGPGDEELISVKGKRRLAEAEVLVYDRLVNPIFQTYVPEDCQLIDVGKVVGKPCIKQEEIIAILIEKAQQGLRVVRLKSGDPYIFGRGGEEALALQEAGISFEVVPGISSATAALAYAGIPVTHRNLARSFHVFTAHLEDPNQDLDWSAIAQLEGSLVFLMGMKHLEKIQLGLLEAGYDPNGSAAIVEWGTYPKQRTLTSTLENLLHEARAAQFQAPCIIVIGAVVDFRESLNFFESGPLFGKKILIQESEKGRLPQLLKDAGANVVTFPARNQAQACPVDLPDFAQLTGLLVADLASWSFFLQALQEQSVDIRQLGQLKIAAVGNHTAQSIEKTGVILDAQAAHLDDEGFQRELEEMGSDWLVLTSDSKLAWVEQEYSYPVMITHQLSRGSEVDTSQWDDVDAVCLPNVLAVTNFLEISQEGAIDWGITPILVMGTAGYNYLETAERMIVHQTGENTLASLIELCQEVLE